MEHKSFRPATFTDFPVIVSLINETTLALHRKGIMQWVYPCDENLIKKEISRGYVYLFLFDGKIIGTFSIKPSDEAGIDLLEADNLYFYRTAITPEYQGKKLGLDIVNYAIGYARKAKKILYLDCWAGNVKLKQFYSDAGFEIIGEAPVEDFFITVFKLKI